VRLLTCLFVLSVTACAAAPSDQILGPRTLESIQSDLLRLDNQIKAAVGYPRCDTLSDCDVIATGHKPCGGPDRFVVYSKVQSNQGLLRDNANRRVRLEREYNSLANITSDCMIEMKPNVSCRRGVCESIDR